jgi:hypothetical protein
VPGLTTSNPFQNLLQNTISNASQNFLYDRSTGSCGKLKSPNYACSSKDMWMARYSSSNQELSVAMDVDEIKRLRSKLKAGEKVMAIKNGCSIRFLNNGIDLGDAINNGQGEKCQVVELKKTSDSVMIFPNP